MAEFSKQYCELYENEMVPTFDIFEIADSLDLGYYSPIICEGFGFIAIAKDESGEIIVAMPIGELTDSGESQVEWKNINQLLTKN